MPDKTPQDEYDASCFVDPETGLQYPDPEEPFEWKCYRCKKMNPNWSTNCEHCHTMNVLPKPTHPPDKHQRVKTLEDEVFEVIHEHYDCDGGFEAAHIINDIIARTNRESRIDIVKELKDVFTQEGQTEVPSLTKGYWSQKDLQHIFDEIIAKLESQTNNGEEK
jgi:ribosomal protein L40E